MLRIGHFTFAPLRSLQQWRDTASYAKNLHPVLYYVWCLLGTPFWLVACFGYVFCLLFFPSMLLGLGLAGARYDPGIGWFIYALVALIFWTTMFIIQLSVAMRQLRARVLDVEAWTIVLLMALSYPLSMWFVSYEIGRPR